MCAFPLQPEEFSIYAVYTNNAGTDLSLSLSKRQVLASYSVFFPPGVKHVRP